jgi:hypothetical protein
MFRSRLLYTVLSILISFYNLGLLHINDDETACGSGKVVPVHGML